MYCWLSFGFLPTKLYQKRKIRRSTRFPPCSVTKIGTILLFFAIKKIKLYFFNLKLDREEFATQNCILASNDPGTGPLIVSVSTNTPAHTENTALLAETRTIKTNPS